MPTRTPPRLDRAIEVLEQLQRRHPHDPELLNALASLEGARGNHAAATRWMEKMNAPGSNQ